ncbi:hypothetical protein BDY21DRAFT_341898, partial [Lineolata rhizophorae]
MSGCTAYRKGGWEREFRHRGIRTRKITDALVAADWDIPPEPKSGGPAPPDHPEAQKPKGFVQIMQDIQWNNLSTSQKIYETGKGWKDRASWTVKNWWRSE